MLGGRSDKLVEPLRCSSRSRSRDNGMREFATTLGYGMGNSVVENSDLKVGGLRRDKGIRWDRPSV